MRQQVRWGILGTANIARAQFLPGLREAGGGRAVVVGGRDGAAAGRWAAGHGVEEGVEGYAAVLDRPDVDAVYIPLPNNLHAEWTVAAMRAGKAVLCEKPLSVDASSTGAVAAEAKQTGALLWEAFVFPFQPQHRRIVELLEEGAIGEPREVVSAFHFELTDPGNIRLRADLGGGAVADVGCYPIRFAQELFGPPPGPPAVVGTGLVDGGVEVDAAAIVDWGGERRLLLTCGFRRSYDTGTRVLGTSGSIELTNPFHPGPSDSLLLRRRGAEPVLEHPTTDRHSFTAAIRHIHAVLAGEAAPLHLAAGSSPPTAAVLDAVVAACRATR